MLREANLLNGIDAIHMATVLDDCIDQLTILGHIMPALHDDIPAAEKFVSKEMKDLLEAQKEQMEKYDNVLNNKKKLKQVTKNLDKLSKAEENIHTACRDLRNSTHVFGRSIEQNPLTADNVKKIQDDREFVKIVLSETFTNLIEKSSFQPLVDAIEKGKEEKASIQEILKREREGREGICQLKHQLQNMEKMKEEEVNSRNEMIAHLKDQLQEMKAKTTMEGRYVRKSCKVKYAQSQKRNELKEKELEDEIDKLRQKIDFETRVNAEIESFLHFHQIELQEKLEFWMEKYEKDVEDKQLELEFLKINKAKNFDHLLYLTKLYKEYEHVVVDNRVEKERDRRKAKAEAEELVCTIKLQSWWRGVMVRKHLGPYKKKKARKGKKDKKKK